jgi:virginiamycin B lyase
MYPLPRVNSYPFGITAGPDGNLWFTEGSATNKIGRITPSGAITQYGIHTEWSWPLDIASGPDGRLWFAESTGSQIGALRQSSGGPEGS